MDAPIITLRSQERGGDAALIKNLPPEYAKGTFDNLLDYMCKEDEDGLNPPYEGEATLRLANRMKSWKNQIRSNPNRQSFNLYYVDEQGRPSPPLPLESRVSDHLGDMLNHLKDIKDSSKQILFLGFSPQEDFDLLRRIWINNFSGN